MAFEEDDGALRAVHWSRVSAEMCSLFAPRLSLKPSAWVKCSLFDTDDRPTRLKPSAGLGLKPSAL